MIIDEAVYLEHYGVQGMKWGVRRRMNKASVANLRGKGLSRRQAKNTVRYQNRVDAMKMAATGRRGKTSIYKQLNNRAIANQQLSFRAAIKGRGKIKAASAAQLKMNQTMQAKVLAGKKPVTSALLKVGGISIKNINYSTAGGNKPTDYSRKKAAKASA